MTRLTQGVLMLVTAAATFAAVPAAHAGEDDCAPTRDVDPLRLLRQASLDLRGTIPTFEEYEAVRDAADPAAEVDDRIDEMLASEDWFGQVREYHRGLLWSTVDSSILDNVFHAGRRIRATGADLWRVPSAGRWFRGSSTVVCLDEEQTEFDADGRPVPISTYADPNCDGPGADGICSQEGYVWVEPFWAPGTEIKVCAYDAQTFALGVNGVPCTDYHTNDPWCGCGESLELCGPDQNGLDIPVRDALAEEPLRIFEEVVRTDQPYLAAFTTQTSFVNGPLAHFYEHMTGLSNQAAGGGVTYEAQMGPLPQLDYVADDEWVGVQRDGAHAGVLTTFAYLIRFASNRSRANRFYTAFYCDPFVPPEEGLPPQEEDPPPNLRERNGCDGCHEELEPAASHWGRWRTGGTHGYMSSDEVDFLVPREDCQCGEGTDQATCNFICRSYYVTADNAHPDEYALYGGLPQARAWLNEPELANIEEGPAKLVSTAPQRRQVAACMVKNMAEHLLGRSLDGDDLAWLEDHTEALEADNYRFTEMVRRMVIDERYRAID